MLNSGPRSALMEPRGFGFVQFVYPADAADAKHYLDGENFLGRELMVVFVEENWKKPSEMRARDRIRGRSYDRRRSPLGYFLPLCYGSSYSHQCHPGTEDTVSAPTQGRLMAGAGAGAGAIVYATLDNYIG
ncbi:serine/arginine-rich SC35-like splicing factor SCL33 [Tripterygium wilfordii]|uniref:Serine/arginine-rich SC35-like splicing factor SCL33 n=1 Tax=Tripterygium wilfordii TaxID=458696 RepID=A0A7J7DW91_TRIWF|nr:serine/arginine-rich SC35-like splicing factor SCL33 [Tripterygium wilfordii]